MQQEYNNEFLIFNFKFLISRYALCASVISAFLGIVVAGTVNAQAVCPVCAVAIGAGLGLSRWLGVDDLVSSVWIGAVLLTIVIWTIFWLKKRNLTLLNAAKPQSRFAKLFNWVKDFKFSGIVAFLFYYLSTFIPLYYVKIVGHPLNTVFGIDKIIFGTAAGTIVLWLALWLHNYLKKHNNDKSYFPYQRVVIPVAALLLTSLLFYLLLQRRII